MEKHGATSSNSIRLAIVQHGDFREALDIWREGGAEPYSGLRYSVEILEQLLGDRPFVMVNRGTQEEYESTHRNGTLIGFSHHDFQRGLLKGPLQAFVWVKPPK